MLHLPDEEGCFDPETAIREATRTQFLLDEFDDADPLIGADSDELFVEFDAECRGR